MSAALKQSSGIANQTFAETTTSPSVAGLVQNQYLQASHHLLSWIEGSKNQVENLIDTMPVLFLVINRKGAIQRCNNALSTLLGADTELLLGENFFKRLLDEDTKVFEQKVAELVENNSQKPNINEVEINLNKKQIEFETAFLNSEGKEKFFVWTLEKFPSKHPEAENWFSIFGRDISAVKDYERKLARIFSTIPVGVLQVNSELKIVSPYSARCEFLLGERNLHDRNLFDVLFQPSWDTLTVAQREAIGNLMNLVGYADVQFELVKDNLPRYVKLEVPSNVVNQKQKLSLGITYQPVFKNQLVDGFLVLIEDRTELEKTLHESETRRIQDNANAARYVECLAVDSHLRSSVLGDLEAYLLSITREYNNNLTIEALRTLHAIKGTARLAGLSKLKNISHTLEDDLLHKGQKGNQLGLKNHKDNFHTLFHEAKNCLSLFRFFEMEEKGQIQEYIESTLEPIANVEQKIRAAVFQVIESSEKKCQVEFRWNDIHLMRKWVRELSDCIMHMVTNSIDHGIETPEVRAAKGKPAFGKILVSATKTKTGVCIMVEDDGQGISHETIRAKLIEKRTVAQAKVHAMSDRDILQFVFNHGFTTANSSTTVSGRGIGLNTVLSTATKWGGIAEVASTSESGTCIVIKLPLLGDKNG